MRKRSANAAAATNVFLCESVVLTQRQQQMFFARKRSGSGKCFLCESVVLTQRHRCRSVSCYRMDAMILG
ncbi:hypothetical protein [Bacillus sp. RS11]|uniref:hypothetical protein n=1 Tax=Lysinibacillus sp. RS11 TaxID=3242682 RepID=UPI0035C7140A